MQSPYDATLYLNIFSLAALKINLHGCVELSYHVGSKECSMFAQDRAIQILDDVISHNGNAIDSTLPKTHIIYAKRNSKTTNK